MPKNRFDPSDKKAVERKTTAPVRAAEKALSTPRVPRDVTASARRVAATPAARRGSAATPPRGAAEAAGRRRGVAQNPATGRDRTGNEPKGSGKPIK